MLLIVLQIALPVALLVWLILLPARSIGLYVFQLLAVLACLAGLTSTAIWAFPPWWVPYVFLAVAFLAVLFHIKNMRGFKFEKRPMNWGSRLLFAIVFTLGAFGAYITYYATNGRYPPADVALVDVAAPFPAGTYLVAHGGSTETINAHMKTLDPTIEKYKAWRGASYALDVIRISSIGLRSPGIQPIDPASYLTFGTPLLAPCNGSVASAHDGMPDMNVPIMDKSSFPGNHVIVDCSGFYVFMAHLRKGSVLVNVGQKLTLGEKIAELGNSGNTTEPHLHIHAQRDLPADQPWGGEPLALTINGKFYIRNDRIIVRAND